MNEANDQDPFNNNCYGTLVDAPYKLVSLPVLDVLDFNERIIRGYEEGYGEKELPADLSRRPLARPRRHGHAPRLQLHRPRDPRCTSPRTAPAAWTASPSAPIRPSWARCSPRPSWNEKLATIPDQPTARCSAASGRRPRSTTTAGKKKGGVGGMFNIIIDPSKCKGCAECVTVCDDDALKMVAKTDEVMTQDPQEPPLLQEHRPDERQVHQRQPAHRHDAQGADAHLHRRRRLVRRLRRGDGPADAVRRHRLEVRRPVGHRRRHRLQHRLHLDLSVQPVPGAVDELALRERPGLRHRRAHALGPDGLAGQAALVHRRRRRHVRHRLPGALAACSPAA